MYFNFAPELSQTEIFQPQSLHFKRTFSDKKIFW